MGVKRHDHPSGDLSGAACGFDAGGHVRRRLAGADDAQSTVERRGETPHMALDQSGRVDGRYRRREDRPQFAPRRAAGRRGPARRRRRARVINWAQLFSSSTSADDSRR